MNKLYSALFFLCFSSLALAQRPTVDSLNNLLSEAQNDTVRMNLYYNLGQAYARVNMDSSILHLNEALVLAQDLQLEGSELYILGWLGFCYSSVNNYPKSLKAYLKGIEIGENSDTEKYTHKGILTEEQRINRLAIITHALGNLYGAIGNNAEKIKYYTKARAIALASRDSSAILYTELGLITSYMMDEKLDSALIFAQSALAISEKVQESRIPSILLRISDIYRLKGDSITARSYLQKTLSLEAGSGNTSSLANIYYSFAQLYHAYFNQDSALFFVKSAAYLREQTRGSQGLQSTYSLQSDIYEELGMKDSALVYLKLSVALDDSLNREREKSLMAFQEVGFDEQLKLQELEKDKIKTQSQIRTYALTGGIAVFLIIALFLFRNNRIRSKANAVLEGQNRKIEEQKKDVERTLKELKATQSQLIQSEKMASLGELTAGIAHEIQNPLNFVNNFSELSNELMDEMKDEFKEGDNEEGFAIADDIKQNLAKITHHGKRADAIVKGMLAHSRSGKGEKTPTDLNALAEEYLKLSYHGLRARDKSFNADFKTDFDPDLPKVNVVPQDIGRVLLNLINNAFQACAQSDVENPLVTVKTERATSDELRITITDNGPGIPAEIKDKIFQPFFTTKPTGQGTGLGLSLSYDIVKAHGGEIKISNTQNGGAEFCITLPTNA